MQRSSGYPEPSSPGLTMVLISGGLSLGQITDAGADLAVVTDHSLSSGKSPI